MEHEISTDLLIRAGSKHQTGGTNRIWMKSACQPRWSSIEPRGIRCSSVAVAVANSLALRLAGLSASTTDPLGGRPGRFPDGNLNGALEGGTQCSGARGKLRSL